LVFPQVLFYTCLGAVCKPHHLFSPTNTPSTPASPSHLTPARSCFSFCFICLTTATLSVTRLCSPLPFMLKVGPPPFPPFFHHSLFQVFHSSWTVPAIRFFQTIPSELRRKCGPRLPFSTPLPAPAPPLTLPFVTCRLRHVWLLIGKLGSPIHLTFPLSGIFCFSTHFVLRSHFLTQPPNPPVNLNPCPQPGYNVFLFLCRFSDSKRHPSSCFFRKRTLLDFQFIATPGICPCFPISFYPPVDFPRKTAPEAHLHPPPSR